MFMQDLIVLFTDYIYTRNDCGTLDVRGMNE